MDVSKVVDAVNAAASAGPEYAPSHETAGHGYARPGSKWSIGPATSVPTVVGLTSVSTATVSLWLTSAVQAKSPHVVAVPTGWATALTSPQPLTLPFGSGDGPA